MPTRTARSRSSLQPKRWPRKRFGPRCSKAIATANQLAPVRLIQPSGGHMGFDIYGLLPSSDAGKYFRNNCWWWRPMQALIYLTCADILTVEEMRELGFNDGYAYSAIKSEKIADRLADTAADEKLLASYQNKITGMLPESYKGCWSKDNIL